MKPEIKERVERIHKGEVPEGYKATKVGIIPVDWDVVELSKITNITSSKRVMRSEYSNSGIPFYRSKEIILKSKRIPINECYYITDYRYNNFKNKFGVPEKGDILITAVGTLGITYLVQDESFYFKDGNLLWLKDITPNINKPFLISTFNSNTFTDWVEKVTGGSSQKALTIEKLNEFKFTITKSIFEQQKIAEILSTWDKAIELKEKLIIEKKKLRIAIVTDLLFGLKRFDEFIKSHKYNSTKYTNIPEDWKFIKIGEIATEVSEKNENHDELPVLSCTKHSGLVDSLSYFKRQVFSEDTSTYKQVKKNCFVYATNHIDEGSIGCQNLYENSLVSPMYTVFKTNSKVNNHFLFNLLKMRLYIFIYQVNMSASVDRRGSLRWNEFSKIRIPLPDIAEQNKIVEFIRLVDNEIDLLNKELNQLKEQKRGLMQLLLTGIIRVEMN